MSGVRPHELVIVAQADEGTWAVTLAQTLTVGPNTRIELRREEDGCYVDVALSRESLLRLRDTLGLASGRRWFLKLRRVTRLSVPACAWREPSPSGDWLRSCPRPPRWRREAQSGADGVPAGAACACCTMPGVRCGAKAWMKS